MSEFHCAFCQHELTEDPRVASVRCPSCGRVNAGEEAVDTIVHDEQKQTIGTKPDRPASNILNIELPGMEVIEELGSGGFGSVYRVYQQQLGREIAVKILHQEELTTEDEDRFLGEAIITGNLQHPNIIPIHEIGKDHIGRQFFTMKIVSGQLLSEIIDRLADNDEDCIKEYGLQRLLEIFLDICDAIAYAHSQGVIHRDLKPNNIIIGKFGQVYVLDWGLAKCTEDHEDSTAVSRNSADAKERMGIQDKLTLQGAVMGTPGYMSPEQAAGQQDILNERSDIYSLGAILFELLCFEIPIPGKGTDSLISNTCKGNLKAFHLALRAKRSRAELNAICQKALALRPEDRYQSVTDLIKDIRGVMDDRAISVYSGNLFTVFLRWTRHHRLRASIILSLVFISIISLSFITSSMAVLSEQRAKDAERQQELVQFAQKALQERVDAQALQLEQEKEMRDKLIREQQAQELFIKASELSLRPRKQQEVMKLLNEALTLNPDFFGALYKRAQVYNALSQFDKAINDCDYLNLLAKNNGQQGSAEALCLAGNIWRDRNDGKQNLNKAGVYYQQALAIDPQHPQVQIARVYIAHYTSAKADALKLAQECVKLYPEYWEAHYVLGFIHLSADRVKIEDRRVEDCELAIRSFSHALRLNMRVPRVFQNRGIAFFTLFSKDTKKRDMLNYAITDFETASMTNPYDTASLRNLIKIYYNITREFDKALSVIDRLEAVIPKQHALDATRAYCYEGLKQYDKALESINKALQQHPDRAEFIKFKADMKQKRSQQMQ